MRQLPHLQNLWEEYEGKGLHLFHVESQNHTYEKVMLFTRKAGVTFPNPIQNWSDFPMINSAALLDWGYDSKKLPRTYLIGVEGRVIWEGRFGYDEVLKEELKKVRYPGLFRLEVDRAVRSIAKTFGKGEYGKAWKDVEKKLPLLKDEPALDDARWIVTRLEEISSYWRGVADEAMQEARYHVAIPALETLAGGFSGHDVGRKAAEDLKRLRRDADVKKELAAIAALEELMDEYTLSRRALPGYIERLLAFAKSHEGLRAAVEATELAHGLTPHPIDR